MQTILSRFWLVTSGLGVIFAMVVLLPHALQRTDSAHPFKGVEIMGTDNENYYAARIREAADNGWPLHNPFYTEYKEEPAVQPALPEYLIAVSGKLIGLDAVQSLVWSKAIFAFLLVIVVTGFLSSVTQRRWIALIAAVCLLFSEAALSAPWNLYSFVFAPGAEHDFLRFARPINPQWPVLLFFGTLWLLSSWMKQRQFWKIVLMSVLVSGLIYSYVYAWSYLAVTFALVLAWYLWKRDARRIKDLALLVVLILILSTPYLLQVWEVIHHPDYPEVAMRQGLVNKRELVFGVWMLLFLPLSLLTKKFFKQTWPLYPALALAGVITLNQQLITGKFLVPQHYHWYFLQPLASTLLVILVCIVGVQMIRSTKVRYALGTLIILCSMLYGITQQKRAYATQAALWGRYQNLAAPLAFINTNVSADAVVYSSPASPLRDIIPIYTSAHVFSDIYANLFLVPMSRVRDNYFFDLWLSGFTAADAKKRFPTDMRFALSSNLYSIYYREAAGQYDAIPDNVVNENIALYGVYDRLPLAEKLSRYQLDYIVITPEDTLTARWNDFLSMGTTVFESEGYRIMKVK